LVVAFAVFLDNAPRTALYLGSVLTAKQTHFVAELPTGDVNIVTAVDTFFEV
jgi:hypothetical protein